MPNLPSWLVFFSVFQCFPFIPLTNVSFLFVLYKVETTCEGENHRSCHRWGTTFCTFGTGRSVLCFQMCVSVKQVDHAMLSHVCILGTDHCMMCSHMFARMVQVDLYMVCFCMVAPLEQVDQHGMLSNICTLGTDVYIACFHVCSLGTDILC